MNTIKSSGIVRIERPGPPNVLKYEDITLALPGPGEVLINQKAIGINFLDVFQRNGTFPMDTYPAPLGCEASGVVESVGTGVTGFAAGDRVAYPLSNGAYAEKRLLKASEIFKLPADISHDQAASVMVKGITAHMLIKKSHRLKAGEVVLIHAMTGGVGTLLSDWARSIGAIVIGTVGSAAKKQLALQRGFEHVINLQSENFVDAVTTVTDGRGLDVVYDGIGETTFQKSVDLVKEGGSAVLYGWASGMPVVDMERIGKRKIQYVRPAVFEHYADRTEVDAALAEIFDLVRNGVFDLQKPTIYPLSEAAKAHADLESRKTTGSVILRP